MTQTPRTRARPSSHMAIASMVTLALWRVRRTWRLLLLAGLGILAAVTLVCTVPLYSEVAMTAGLRNILTGTPQSDELTVQAGANVLTPSLVAQESQALNHLMQQRLGRITQHGDGFDA